MKLRFKQQAYQTAAVQAVVDCLAGQPMSRRGPQGVANDSIVLSSARLLENIQQVQRRENLPVSREICRTPLSDLNLDVEMETGTGKTYCYIRTMFELNRAYGWSRFIVVVPSVAIREGVAKSFEITTEHFLEQYGKRIRYFIYDSRQLQALQSFSSDAGLQAMIINAQAFAARGEEARRIYLELDELQSRRPIDVIRQNRPILILDEPQKMEGKATTQKLGDFAPLMVLRYSATHRTEHNRIYRLDALGAYNQKLVKKIAVRGITVKGFSGTGGYVYVDAVRLTPAGPPEARAEMEIRHASGIKREWRTLRRTDNLYDLSRGLEQYRGFIVSDISALENTTRFTNGVVLAAGEGTGDSTESALRRIQIRETIRAHLEKESALFTLGVKVLSLFFIDEVAKYRIYTGTGASPGEYARMFEEEYRIQLDEMKWQEDTPYHRYLRRIDATETHNGYFSADRQGRLINSTVKTRGESALEADDADAYDLILRDKIRLLSLDEPVRFLFSHSALREGWDNPNVFVICTLKHSDNTVSRRQEVGRGLRLAVTQDGDRLDDPATVHQINVLTVVANESYRDFVTGLQQDIRASLCIEDGRRLQTNPPSDASIGVAESQDLWSRTRHHGAFRADFNAALWVDQCVAALNGLKVTPLQYTVTDGEQTAATAFRDLGSEDSPKLRDPAVSTVKYDLLGRIAAVTHLTRKTLAAILRGVRPETFSQYRINPEEFILKTGMVINEQKASVMAERR